MESSEREDDAVWTFVAMEYYALILNRTLTVAVTSRMVCGAKTRGLLAAPPVPWREWRDPEFYPVHRHLARYRGVDIESPAFLALSRANFQIPLRAIAEVTFDPSAKWGMGNVPHSGKLYLDLCTGRRRELILLGDQDGAALRHRLAVAVLYAPAV